MRPSNINKLKEILALRKHIDTSCSEYESIVIDEVMSLFTSDLTNKEDHVRKFVKCLNTTKGNYSISLHKNSLNGSAREKWINSLTEYWNGGLIDRIWGWILYIFSPIAIVYHKIHTSEQKSQTEYENQLLMEIQESTDTIVSIVVILLNELKYAQDSIASAENLIVEAQKEEIKNNRNIIKKYDLNDRRVMRMIQNSYQTLHKIENQYPDAYRIYCDWINNYVGQSKYDFMEYSEDEAERFEVSFQPVEDKIMIYPAIVSKQDKSTIEYGAVAVPIKEY